MITWKPGLLLRIKDYKFEDTNTTRDKYTIVLYTNDTSAFLIHCLTTSQNKIPVPGIQHGCSVHGNIPYYFFPQHFPVGDQGYFFDKDTFIFFSGNVRKEPIHKFERAASGKLFGVTVLGTLPGSELKCLIKCALKSAFIPQDIAALLQSFKETL